MFAISPLIMADWETKTIHISSENSSISSIAYVSSSEESNKGSILGIIVIVCLTVIGIFFPPVLLLNIPLLIFRSFLRQVFFDRTKIRLVSFLCPQCSKNVPETIYSHSVPDKVFCSHCKSMLKVILA